MSREAEALLAENERLRSACRIAERTAIDLSGRAANLEEQLRLADRLAARLLPLYHLLSVGIARELDAYLAASERKPGS